MKVMTQHKQHRVTDRHPQHSHRLNRAERATNQTFPSSLLHLPEVRMHCLYVHVTGSVLKQQLSPHRHVGGANDWSLCLNSNHRVNFPTALI